MKVDERLWSEMSEDASKERQRGEIKNVKGKETMQTVEMWDKYILYLSLSTAL